LPEGGAGWKVHYALFGRSSFTPAAVDEMEKLKGIIVDLKAIDRFLGHARPLMGLGADNLILITT